jgi:crotonobetainyl-CoA:carnitine CoA-transferase CaiB-like acyl-CoA transferase
MVFDARPLTGIRVVTTANALPAAIVGQVLADAGAEVWIVEPPAGSRLRGHAAWPFWTHGQRSVCVDLTTESGQELVRALIDRSDVFVDSWGTGVAARLGLAAEDLVARNPRLIHARISAFGDDSPMADVEGWESVVMAVIGGNTSFANLAARDGPAFVSTPYCSIAAAHLLLHGVLGALVERERSGRGQQVSTTLAQGMLAFDTWNWLLHVLARRYEAAFEMAPPYDLATLVPNTPFFFRLLVALTKDGVWLQFSQTTERLWTAFLRACGLDPEDPVVHDAPLSEDPQVRVAFWETLLAAVRGRTLAEWQAVFDDDHDVWGEVFRTGDDVLDHPQLVADGRVVDNDPVSRMPAALCHSTVWSVPPSAPAPALGEGNADAGLLAEQAVSQNLANIVGREDSPPLAGITIIELGAFFAAPFGATLLAEQGARVIKVEPLDGDPIRNVVPFPELAGIKVLHGKESVALDIGSASGRAHLEQLVKGADVVLQGYRAGVADRLHCTAEDMFALNPELIYVSAPGYGDGMPCGHRPAFAPTMGAASSMAVRNIGGVQIIPSGPDLELPVVKHTAMRLASAVMAFANADGFAGLGVATTLLLGILGKVRYGRGDHLRTSMLGTMAHSMADTIAPASSSGERTPAPDDQLFGLTPLHRLYRTAEGWVMLAVTDADACAALLDMAGAVDPDLLEEQLCQMFMTAASSDWQQRMRAIGVTCVVVSEQGVELTAMLKDFGPSHGFVTTGNHEVLGEYPRLTELTRFSRSRSVLGDAPLCGQHTDQILAEFITEEVRA